MSSVDYTIRASSKDLEGAIGLYLRSQQDQHLVVIGATMPVSSRLEERVKSLTIFPQRGKTNIIVLTNIHYYKGVVHKTTWLFGVEYADEVPNINLKDMWFPSGGKLCQTGEGRLDVKIGDETYTTSREYAEGVGYNYVPDGNLLCRYLVGDAAAEEVEAAALEYKEETDLIAELRGQLNSLQRAHEQQMQSLLEMKTKLDSRLHDYQLEGQSLASLMEKYPLRYQLLPNDVKDTIQNVKKMVEADRGAEAVQDE